MRLEEAQAGLEQSGRVDAAGGLLGVGVLAMIAYVVAGPDGTKQRVAGRSIPEAARS